MLQSADGRADLRRTFGLGFALPLCIYVSVTLGYDSGYSYPWFSRPWFLHVFDGPVTRYRVVGRELVLFTADRFNDMGFALGNTPNHLRGELFTALVVVNGVAFLGLALLLYRQIAQRDGWLTPYLVVIGLVAASGYVMTPYDNLAYLCTAVLFLAILGSRPLHPILVAAIAAVGVATRESVFVGVAAVAAAAIATGTLRTATGVRLLASILGGGATYIGLRLIIPSPDGGTFLLRQPLAMNWHQGPAVAAVITVFGGAALWACYPPLGRREWLRTARRWLWLLCVPYIIVLGFGGLWFETPRMLMPVFLCEYLLRVTSAVSAGTETPARVGANGAGPPKARSSTAPPLVLRPRSRDRLAGSGSTGRD